ncbi:MAG TPA: DUF255 domain-containing protein [Phaeodactylibacter sp.]|nr:DUF255 domain-containing protein [Phaeodactylibacter sp.]
MKPTTFISFLFPLLIFTASSCGGSKNSLKKPKPNKVGVHFVESETLTAVLEQAEKENKLVFVDFYATWCVPCKMMDEDVFPDKTIGEFFKKNFISYKVNGLKGNGINLATVFNVTAYPTLLFLNPKGKVLVSRRGAAYHSDLMNMAKRALEQHRLSGL